MNETNGGTSTLGAFPIRTETMTSFCDCQRARGVRRIRARFEGVPSSIWRCGKCAMHMFQVHSTLVLRSINKTHVSLRFVADLTTIYIRQACDLLRHLSGFSCGRAARELRTFIQLFVSICYAPQWMGQKSVCRVYNGFTTIAFRTLLSNFILDIVQNESSSSSNNSSKCLSFGEVLNKRKFHVANAFRIAVLKRCFFGKARIQFHLFEWQKKTCQLVWGVEMVSNKCRHLENVNGSTIQLAFSSVGQKFK